MTPFTDGKLRFARITSEVALGVKAVWLFWIIAIPSGLASSFGPTVMVPPE